MKTLTTLLGPGALCPLAPLVMALLTLDKCTAVKFEEPRMSNHFSELRERNYVSSAMCPECPTKEWRGKSCWLNPRKATQRSSKV